MSLDNVAPSDVSAPASAPAPVSAPADTSPISARDAAAALSNARWEKARKAQQDAPPAAPVEQPAEQPLEELAQEADAAPPEEATGETQEAEPADTLPPIEPPRSWTTEEKDRFRSLPRETQEYLAQREQDRDRSVRQSQNEAAELKKAIAAEKQAVEQARQQYEQALPALLQSVQEAMAGEFADIITTADVINLSKEDPFRFNQWQAHQMKVAAVAQEVEAAKHRQVTEFQSKWAEFAQREDSKVMEAIPELADPTQRETIQKSAVNYLRELGFTDQELGQAWNGQASISPRDHRFQILVRDAAKYREAQATAKKTLTTAKPLPPVQKPGVAPPKGASNAALIDSLSKKLSQTGDWKVAAQLRIAKRASK
jgi:hypothetical protein